MKRNQAIELLSKVNTLRLIHEKCAKLEHGIKQRNQWEPYIPTHFIYAFFTFNTLYNIDWDDSLIYRRIRYKKKNNEHKKIESYLQFCCEDEEFIKIYKDFFIKYITSNYNIRKIFDDFEYISIDTHYNGNIKIEDISLFKKSCYKCLVEGKFDSCTLYGIYNFIYLIRCNLFHGIKSIEELKIPAQQNRLDIYSTFIIAINQMVFSYLQYLKEGVNITERFDDLLVRLYWKDSDNSALLSKARNICLNAHKGQFDKVGQPYHLHPERVAARCTTEKEKIVALLHDTIEDTDVTPEYLKEQGFSDEIIKAILSVTKRENEKYGDFVARAKRNPIGRYVKIHDLEDNMDLSRLSELTDEMVARQRKYIIAYKFLKE